MDLTQRLWTKTNGACTNKVGFDDLSVSMEDTTMSDIDKCTYLIRCALSQGIERDCPCDHMNCIQVMKTVCVDDASYFYPRGGLIRPYVFMRYQWKRDWKDEKAPDFFVMNGSIKCREYQGYIDFKNNFSVSDQFTRWNRFEYYFCLDARKNFNSSIQYDVSCLFNSRAFNGHLYAFLDICEKWGPGISQYRIMDQTWDCGNAADEQVPITNITLNKAPCWKLRKHRFLCSEEQYTCMHAGDLGDQAHFCKNNFDEVLYGTDLSLADIHCSHRNDPNCQLLKNYITSSWISNSSYNTSYSTAIRFRAYCDGTWDLYGHTDELPSFCRVWICRNDQYQCQTGQCIDLAWVCDDEWDCSDASDEEAITLYEHNWSPHNKKLVSLIDRIANCRNLSYSRPFPTLCNRSHEYPCYLANVKNPLDIDTFRPCINLTQIGDYTKNCEGEIDEKNTFRDPSRDIMIGMAVNCDNHYAQYPDACTGSICQNTTFCSYRSKNSTCSGPKDVLCRDGSCASNARCNKNHECLPYGEDEYGCSPHSNIHDQRHYRDKKNWRRVPVKNVEWGYYPYPITPTVPLVKTARIQLSNDVKENPKVSYVCNRGVAVFRNDTTQCLCPPTYYGERCEFFSDRLSIITHVDQSPEDVISIQARLLFNGNTVDHYEFYYNRAWGIAKQKFHLLYSRSEEMLKYGKNRYFNRTDIEQTHPYAVHFDVYGSHNNHSVNEIGSFQFPIYFDFLPSHRLATILKFSRWYGNGSLDPCFNNSQCPMNAVCKPILNNYPTVYCTCNRGFFGLNCQNNEPKCDTYCSLKSLCKPGYRGQLTNTNNPFCMCPYHYFGPRCHLHYNACDPNPCANNGTCYFTNDRSGKRPFHCLCAQHYYGDRCEDKRSVVRVELDVPMAAQASVIQLYNVVDSSFELIIEYQAAARWVPLSFEYRHEGQFPPVLGILKTYSDSFANPQLFLLYSQPNTQIINISSTPHGCPNAMTLLSKGKLKYFCF
ncbi:unnamed protein product [Adineta steineri]|uniref:Uncharacterized protein n=1 Tax=Adineta steineri TaxID=433720 RepID=A0A814E5A0_9BILA|nr:unnamed protein product [Adineta steineri]CAF4019517.1 unnamed protein product [Adineta steineri]